MYILVFLTINYLSKNELYMYGKNIHGQCGIDIDVNKHEYCHFRNKIYVVKLLSYSAVRLCCWSEKKYLSLPCLVDRGKWTQ